MLNRTLIVLLMFIWVPASANGTGEKTPLPPAPEQVNVKKTSRENSLGKVTIGASIADIKKNLKGLKEDSPAGVLTGVNWTIWFDPQKQVVKGMLYEEKAGVKSDVAYPKTGRGITIGNIFKEVDAVYDKPEQYFVGKSPFILRNSELAFIVAYPSKGLWIMYMNQNPYTGKPAWRVTAIAVGDNDVIGSLLAGMSSYAVPAVSMRKRNAILSEYAKQHGKGNELEIYDDYQLNIQAALFERVKSKGEFIITPLMVIPRDEAAARAFVAEYAQTGPAAKEVDAHARARTTAKFRIRMDQLDTVLQHVKQFGPYLLKIEVESGNKQVLNDLNLPEGQCR